MVKFLHWKGLVTLAAAFASMGAYAATPIANATDLANIGSDPAGDYELTADIVLTGEWMQIGNNDNPFTGTLDGKGHTISGLTITDNSNWVGLFGAVTGTVKNINFVDVNIYGNEHVGIVAGRVRGGGVIENVFTSGYVCGRDHTGGIVGDAGDGGQTATVKNCASTAYVLSRDYQAGGIAGWTKGDVLVQNNVFYGFAMCTGWGATGGIVGFIEDGTTTVTGNVCAAYLLEGMFGAGARNTWGIAGDCYNENSILVATDNLLSDATVIKNHWYVPDFEGESSYDRTTEYLDNATAPVDHNGILTPAADLQKAATYTGIGFGDAWKLGDNYAVLSFMSLPINGDYIHTEAIPAEVFINTKLDLKAFSTLGREVTIASSNTSVISVEGTTLNFLVPGTSTVTLTTVGNSFCAGATVTLNITVEDFDPTIATADDIAKMRANPSANFVLAADIDLAGVAFTPIPNFSGSLDGQGHWIRNIKCEDANTAKRAFISNFGGTFIKNVGFEGCSFIGNEDCAAVVGETTGEGVISNVVVNNCYIQGRDHVGSIAGKLNGGATIENCIANATCYTRQYQCGGIVGCGLNGVVDKCIFAGNVAAAGTTNLAAMVSLFDADNVTIKNCLAAAASYTGNQNYNANMGNLYGRPITLENNWYAPYQYKNGSLFETNDPNSETGNLAKLEEIRSQEWYSEVLGFDFDNDWKFLAGAEGYMLPVLKWMEAPLTTVLFHMPSEDGVNLPYSIGLEKYEDYHRIIGSWGQSTDVEQLSGEDYANIYEGDIYAGNADGNFVGAGEAVFKVVFDEAIANLFTVTGNDEFTVNVSMSGATNEIATVEDFLKIRKNPAGSYVLTADIDLSGETDFAGFCNDGSTVFAGSIDGQGHTVSGFKLIFDSGSNKGLFGKTQGATLKNIAFTQFTLDGGTTVNHVGLIGQGSATLENVAIVGTSIGNDHVGLVAGDADGIVMTNCYATGKVIGRSQVGGYFGCTLVGGCTVDKCLSNIEASASYRGWTGGFIGLVDKADSQVTITNCVSIGNCSTTGDGSPHVTAPFIAGNNAGDGANALVIFTGNIYNTNAVMDADTEWPSKNTTLEGGNVEPAEGLNVTTLQKADPYTQIGWDFNGVWTINADSEYKFPVLATVEVTDFTDNASVDNVIADAETTVTVAAVNGEIVVAGLGEASVITVYTTTGVQVANVAVNAAEATIAVPANGLYIVAVATEGTVATTKVVVK